MGDTTVVGYSITRSTGALTLIPGSPFTVPGGVGSADDLASDPQGRFLFVGSELVPAIWVFTINSATGVLTPVAGSPFITGLAAGGVTDVLTVDASSKFLYAGQTDPNLGVGGFTISPTGTLTAMAGSPFLLGVAQIHANPKSELLLGVAEVADGTTGATDPHIYVYALDPNTGVPSAVAGSPFLTLAAPFDFAISPNGNYVYALEAFVGVGTVAPIEGFSITGTGTMASLGTFGGVPTAEACEFDQSGVYLFCANSMVGSMLTVNVANTSTGGLTHGLDLSVSPNFPFAVTD
jgi:6-phosphogluconolactonase (cycloisomerase 2 family)